MIGQMIYILCYGMIMAGLGLLIGYRWGRDDGSRKEWERHERLRKLNNKSYGDRK